MPPREQDFVGKYTLTRSTRSQQPFKPLSRGSRSVSIPSEHAAHAPSTPKASRIRVPDKIQVQEDLLRSPQSSNGGSPPSSADILPTIFKGLEKETKTKPLGDIGNSRGANARRTENKPGREEGLSPDAKGLQMHMDRKRKPVKKFQLSRNVPNTAKISATQKTAQANIHALPATTVTKDKKVTSESRTPTKGKAEKVRLKIPALLEVPKSNLSASKRSIRLYHEIGDAEDLGNASLPTPRMTQTSSSPKIKRQSSDEEPTDRSAKTMKKDSGYLSVASSPLSSPPDSFGEEEPDTKCSLCSRKVDRTLHEMYSWPSSYDQATYAQKDMYCRWHRKKEAEQECERRGYPIIDWVEFENKLHDYNSNIQQLLDQPETSHYRKELKRVSKIGKVPSFAHMQRGMQQDMQQDLQPDVQQDMRRDDGGYDYLVLGFYGHRGQNIIAKHITNNFHNELRSRRVGDYVMTTIAGGVPGYIRLVLAPELAALLIKDEMTVSIERAREILEESRLVGEAMNDNDDTGKKAGRRSYVDELGNEYETDSE